MDDSLIGSPDRQTYLLYLEVLFAALASCHELGKMCFCCSNFGILDHTISAAG
jgi:hypothetical protein